MVFLSEGCLLREMLSENSSYRGPGKEGRLETGGTSSHMNISV